MKKHFIASFTMKGFYSKLLSFGSRNYHPFFDIMTGGFKRRISLVLLLWVLSTTMFAQVNDEPCDAILLPDPTEACHFYVSTNVGFTPTSLPTLPTTGIPTGGNCYWSATTSLDAWFKVVVPANGMIDVSIDKTAGLITHIFAVYRKNTTCNSLTAITGKPSLSGTIGLRTCAEYGTAGSTPPFNMYTGLTPGDTVFIRVWNKSTASPGAFGICVSTPINDNCSNPTYLCDLNGYTGITSTSYTVDTPDNITSGGAIFFTNTIENNAWFAFVARDTSITIHVDNYCEGSGQAMQMVIYDATNCTNFVRKGDGFSETVAGAPLTAQRTCKLNCDYTANGLIPGQTYYLMTDGASNALCHYTLTVNSSDIFTVDAGADMNICLGNPVTLNAFAPGVGSTFFWKQRVGGVLSDIGAGATQTINPGPTQATTYIVEVTGGSLCSGVIDSLVVTVSDCSNCPTVLVNDTSYCGSALFNVVATPSIAANYEYQWTVPAGFTNPGNVSNFLTNVAGNYIVKLISANYLCNTDFEDNNITTLSGYSGGTIQTSEANVPCWKTTATDGKLEVWNNTNTWCTPECNAYSGTQFAELNATQAANLYQDFTVMPGSSTEISFAHRGRSGTDVMEVQIGPVGGPYSSLGQFSDGNTAWGFHTVNYSFPNNGVTNYRILFIPISSSGGLSFGNFLDAISINLNTCSAPTDTATVLKNCACPTAAISYTGSPWCSNATLQNVALTGTGTYTGGKYTSSPAGLAIDSITGVITPNASSAGSYLITYTIAPTATCATAVIATTNVSITAAPTAVISYTSPVFCTSLATAQPVTLSGTGSYTGGSYSATPTGLSLNGTSGAITPSSSTAQLYTITYSYPASGGCAAGIADTTVTIAAIPTANIIYSASPYCTSISSAQTVTLTGTSGGTYSTTSGLSLNNVTGSIVPSTSTAGNYVVTYTIAAAGGCPLVSDTANVVITAAPTAVISYTSPVFCTSLATAQPVTLSGTGSYTGGSYSATPTGLSLNGTSGAITPSSSTAQLYTITYSYPASGGCAAGFTDTTVTIAAIPTANIIYSASPYCTSISSAQTITLTGTSGGTYSTTSGLSLNNVTGSIVPSTSTAGNYVVTYTIAAMGGCPLVSDTANVTINGLPLITISGNNSICKNESTTLLASGADSFVWSDGPTTDSITVNPVVDMTYTVTGTLLGCTNTSSYLVTVKPLPVPTISGVTQLCVGDTITLTASGATSYVWSPSVGLSSTSTASVLAFPEAASLYKVVATLNNCVDSTTIQLQVNPLPTLQIQSNLQSGCEPLPILFSLNSTPQAQSAIWSFGNGTNSSILAPPAYYLNEGIYDVNVNVTDVNGCKNSFTENAFITVYPKPVVSFTYSPTTGMVNEEMFFTSSYSQTPATWNWYFGDGNTQSNSVSTANYSYTYTGTYTAIHVVETEFGCKDTSSKSITVITKIVVPNVLTPNNDGYNDTFFIEGLQYSEGAGLKIYNRWGKLIYESSSYKNDWDGENHAEGVYFYILTLPEYLQAGPFSGSVSLFR